MDVLKLKYFKNRRATINFINIFNDAFDIFDSHVILNSLRGTVNKHNYDKISSIIQKTFYYFNKLKLVDGQLVLKSQRAIEFLGFLVSLSSLINLRKH